MTTQEKVYHKMFKDNKTELASQKIELNVTQALNSLKSDAKGKVNSASNDIASAIKQLDKTIVKMENAEKDLGVNLKSEISEIRKTYNKAKSALKNAESLISDLASL